MSNSSTMTLEEKLVQTIKDRELYALVTDEDAITKLVERAIHEALFQPKRKPRSYGGYDETDSPLVAATREVAKAVAQKVAEREIDAVIGDDTTGPLIRKFVVEALPEALVQALVSRLSNITMQSYNNNVNLHSLASRLGVNLQNPA